MFAYLEILRPLNGLMSVFAVFIAAVLIELPISSQLLLAFIVVFLISSGGMIINDYFDYKIDKINRPKRPIPSKRISRKAALSYAISLFLIANIIALFLNLYTSALAIFNTFIIFIYSSKLKRRLLIGNLFVSWLVASTFFFGSLLKEMITVTILILFLLSFSSNIGREIAKSIEDVKGDRKIKAKTLPIVAGKNFSAWIACIFIIFAIIFSFLPYIFGLLNINYLILVIISDVVFVFSCFIVFISPKKSQRIMKIAMFIALVAFLVGTY